MLCFSCKPKVEVNNPNRFTREIKPITTESITQDGMTGFKVNNKWGFYNENGEIVIQPKYDFIIAFQDGICPVSIGDKWGIIDKKGNYVYPLSDILDEELFKIYAELRKEMK